MQTAEIQTRPKWTSKQLDAFILLRDYPRVLLYGGSRSGKTRAHCEFDVTACLEFPGLRGLIVRERRNAAKDTVWHETLLSEVLPRYPREIWDDNKSDLYITFANGSEIWVSGTDDQARIEKILGRGVGFAYLNEASQISYKAFSVIRTRLAQKITGWVPRIQVDCNPPGPKHWMHRVFIDHVEPVDGKRLDPRKYASLLMNPIDNRENLPDGYLDDLDELPENERRRFKLGEWVKPTGAIFPEYNSSMLIDRADIPDCERYIVGVDMVTYAAVLIGLQRYRKGNEIRHKVYIVDSWGRGEALAWEANAAIREKWAHYDYVAYIDHNLGKAGTREFDQSRLAVKGQGSVEAGIIQLQTIMHQDDFRVAKHCAEVNYEFENYHRDENGAVVKQDDHYIDACRMAVYSTIRKRRIIDN